MTALRPVVVKLGGSNAFSPMLRPWLRAMECGPDRAMLVPGGGPFADAVRDAQGRMGFDDRAADAMALLAMAQYGLALASLCERLVVAETEEEFERAWRERRVPVWAPMRMLAEDPCRTRSWDVTSDSLALWLACRIDAEAVLLVKQAPVHGSADAAALARDGVVDAAFPRFRASFGGQVRLAGPDDVPPGAWGRESLPGVAVAGTG